MRVDELLLSLHIEADFIVENHDQIARYFPRKRLYGDAIESMGKSMACNIV